MMPKMPALGHRPEGAKWFSDNIMLKV
jgi:hypothetical protein